MTKKYLYGAAGLAVLALIAIGVASLPGNAKPALGQTVDDMNRDLLQFRLTLAARQDEMSHGGLSAESRAELSTELSAMADKLGSYQGKLGDAWAGFVGQMQTDIASLKSTLEGWNRTLAESSDTEMSAESKARLSTELTIFANKLDGYQNEIQ